MNENVRHTCGYSLWQVKVFDELVPISASLNADGTTTLGFQAHTWHYDYYSFLDGSQRYPITTCPRCQKQITDSDIRMR